METRNWREVAGKWTQTGGWAVADRALFSLANFVVSLLLGRWLTEGEYGSFALAMAVFLFAGTLHQGWVTEPLLVYGPSRYRDRFEAYLGYVVRRHLRFGLSVALVGLAIAAIAASLDRMALAEIFAVTAIVTPWILLQWLARLACYASVGPRRAAIAGATQLIAVLAGLYGLRSLGMLSTISALALLGVAGGVTGLALTATLRPRLRDRGSLGSDADSIHQRYGLWAGATGLLTWIPGQVYYVVLPAVGAAAAGGSLRALMNLVLPLMQVFIAISLVLTTVLARARADSSERFARVVRVALVTMSAVALLYLVALVWKGAAAMHWLYDGRYDAIAGLLPLVGLIPLLGIGAAVLAPALRAREQPDRVFVAYAASTATAVTLGLALTIRYGVGGAAAALAATTTITTLVLAYVYVAGESADAAEATAASGARPEPELE